MQNPVATADDDVYKQNQQGLPISQGLLGRPRAQRRASVGGKWSTEEDALLKEIVQVHGAKSWKKVYKYLSQFKLCFLFVSCM